jgi:hypothetical protein
MFLAKAFSTAWQAADAGAKAAAAAIATGAKVVGQIPVVAAKLENTVEGVAFSGLQAVTRGTVAVAEGAAITASEWQGWMDVKSAQVLRTLHVPVDVAAEQREAEQRTKNVESACSYLQKAVDGTLSSMQDKLQRANAQRLKSAQALRSKIAATGGAAGAALSQDVADLGKNIESGLNKADGLTVDGLVDGIGFVARVDTAVIGTVAGAYSKAKAWFTGQKVAGPCQTCQLPQRDPGSQLFTMVAKEKLLIATAKQKGLGSSPAVLAVEAHVDAGSKALMAADVYDDPPKAGQVAPGWTRVSDAELRALNLSPDDFHPNPNDSDFRAALYKSDDQPPKYTLAFKGTTMTSESDWKNNIRQGLGLESDYYQRAQKLALKVKYNVGEFEVTGHSLGGGLASAAAAVTGAKGITFNAAGLNPETVGAVDGAALNSQLKTQLTNYHVDGEVLTTLQTHTPGLPEAAGTPAPLPAQAGDDMVKKHLMPSVDEGLLDQGTKSESELGQLVGSP